LNSVIILLVVSEKSGNERSGIDGIDTDGIEGIDTDGIEGIDGIISRADFVIASIRLGAASSARAVPSTIAMTTNPTLNNFMGGVSCSTVELRSSPGTIARGRTSIQSLLNAGKQRAMVQTKGRGQSP